MNVYDTLEPTNMIYILKYFLYKLLPFNTCESLTLISFQIKTFDEFRRLLTFNTLSIVDTFNEYKIQIVVSRYIAYKLLLVLSLMLYNI